MDQLLNFDEIIAPWIKQFDKRYNRHYYFNPKTNESIWELPNEVQQKIKDEKELIKKK